MDGRKSPADRLAGEVTKIGGFKMNKFKMHKGLGKIFVPVPAETLAQLIAMSAFNEFETMSFEKVWDDIDKQCEKTAGGLSGYVYVTGIARSISEVEKGKGAKEAQTLIDRIMTRMSGKECKEFMKLVAKASHELNKKHEEEI